MRPREKWLFWKLASVKYSKVRKTKEYQRTFMELMPEIYERFEKCDAYEIMDRLFPECISSSNETLKFLNNYALIFKHHPAICHFIFQRLDYLNHLCSSNFVD